MMSSPHTSVLLDEILHFFEGKSLRYFVDATLGAGGHSEAILKAHPEIERFIGIDQDPVARIIAAGRLAPWKEKVTIVPKNFDTLSEELKKMGLAQVDGILFDLGVSSMQFDMPEKGFSFMHDSPLDMRMNPDSPLTAAEIINQWSEGEMGRIFREFGEEKQWRSAARAIVAARTIAPILTTFELVEVVKKVIFSKKKGFNPATLIFQALRIAVNKELDVLAETLPKAITHLRKGGRLAAISFHSLEDRIVKNVMRFASSDKQFTSGLSGLFLDKEPTVSLITKKPVTPSLKEVENNPRSRSAKLRVVEKR